MAKDAIAIMRNWIDLMRLAIDVELNEEEAQRLREAAVYLEKKQPFPHYSDDHLGDAYKELAWIGLQVVINDMENGRSKATAGAHRDYSPWNSSLPIGVIFDGLTFGEVGDFGTLSDDDQAKICEKVGSNIKYGMTHLFPGAYGDASIDVGGIDPDSIDEVREFILHFG